MFDHSEMNADDDLCRLAKLAEFTFDVVQRQQNIGSVSIVDKTLLNELFSNFAKMAKKKNQVLNKLTTPSVNCSGRISITMTSEDTYDSDMQKMMAKVQGSQKLGQRNQETIHHVQTFSEDKDASEKTSEKERKAVSKSTSKGLQSCDASSTTEPPKSTHTAESTPTVIPAEIELETTIQSNDADKLMQVEKPLSSPKLISISPKSTENNVNLDAGPSTPKSVQTSATTAESTERTLPGDKSQNKQLLPTINHENSATSPGSNTKIVWPLQNGIVKDELNTDAEHERTDRKLINENFEPFHASRSELTLSVNSYSDVSTPMENWEHFSYLGRSRSEDSYAEHGSSYMKSLSCQSEMGEYMSDVKQFKHDDDDDKEDNKRRDDDSSSGNDNQENETGIGPNSVPEGAGDRTASKSTQTDDEQNNAGRNQSGGNKARNLQNSNQKMTNGGDNFCVDEHNTELRVLFKPTPRKPSSSKGVNTSPSSSPLPGSIQPKIDTPAGENKAILSNVDSAFTPIKKSKRIKTCFLSKGSSRASSKKVVSFVESKE